MEHFGRIDICVVNPGAGWHQEPLDKLDSAAALEDVQNEVAPFLHLMPLVLPQMYERKWGRAIGIALLPPYDSPAGPGPVPAIETLAEAVEQCDHSPAWRQRSNTSPQDIAEAVAYLCSDAGRFVTGCVLPFLYHM